MKKKVVFGDADPNEVESHLDERLPAARHDLQVASGEPEDQHDHDRRDDADEHDAVDLEIGSGEQHDGREEFANVGPDEATAAAVIGRREEQIESVR